MKCAQASVVMVKPGGTGTPRLAISATLAPFPPRRSRIAAAPSARGPPKRYTNFLLRTARTCVTAYSPAASVSICARCKRPL